MWHTARATYRHIGAVQAVGKSSAQHAKLCSRLWHTQHACVYLHLCVVCILQLGILFHPAHACIQQTETVSLIAVGPHLLTVTQPLKNELQQP
jgi:hypothetical protein